MKLFVHDLRFTHSKKRIRVFPILVLDLAELDELD